MTKFEQKELLVKEVCKALDEADIPFIVHVLLDENTPSFFFGSGNKTKSKDEDVQIFFKLLFGINLAIAHVFEPDNPKKFIKSMCKELVDNTDRITHMEIVGEKEQPDENK